MRADGKAVRLVAQPLDVVENRVAAFQHERRLALDIKMLAAGIAVRPLGDSGDRQITETELGQNRAHRRQLPLPAIDQQQIRPGGNLARSFGPAFTLLLQQPAEPPGQHLAHHGEIIRSDILRLDVELAVLRLHESIRPGDNHATDRVAALDMRVVINLDAGRNLWQTEHPLHTFEQFRLR